MHKDTYWEYIIQKGYKDSKRHSNRLIPYSSYDVLNLAISEHWSGSVFKLALRIEISPTQLTDSLKGRKRISRFHLLTISNFLKLNHNLLIL